jgi:hypothetical protein
MSPWFYFACCALAVFAVAMFLQHRAEMARTRAKPLPPDLAAAKVEGFNEGVDRCIEIVKELDKTITPKIDYVAVVLKGARR